MRSRAGRVAMLGLLLSLIASCSGPSTATRQPPTTALGLHRIPLRDALREEQRCLASPTDPCSQITDRLERLLDEAITATTGLETHSTIPVRTIVEVRTAASKITMDIAMMRVCDTARTSSECQRQLPAIDEQLANLDRALNNWPSD